MFWRVSMPGWAQRIVGPPRFEDAALAQQATVLNFMLWVGILLIGLHLAAAPWLPPTPYLNVNFEGMVLVLQLACLGMLHLRLPRIASWVYVLGLWLVVTLASFELGAITSTGVSTLYTVILAGGVLVGHRGGFGLAALSAAAVSLMVLAFPAANGQPDWTPAVTVVLNFVLVAIMAWIGERVILSSLTRAERSSSLLRQRSAQLQAAAEIGMAASSDLELEAFLNSVTEIIAKRFGLYHVSIMALNLGTRELSLHNVSQGGRRGVHSPAIRSAEGERSIIAHVARTRKPYVSADVNSDPLYLHNPHLPETRSEIALPVLAGSQLFGILDVLSNGAEPLGEEELGALSVLASQIGTAVHNKILLQGAQRHLVELEALNAVALAGMEAASEDDFLRRAAKVVGQSLYPTNFGVLMLDEKRAMLEHVVYFQDQQSSNSPAIPLGEGITGLVALSGESMRVADVTLEPKYISLDPSTRSELCVPLKAHGGVIGVLDIESHDLDSFDQEDEHLLEALAGQISLSLERIRLLSDAEKRATQLAETVKQQEELARLRDQFVQNVSHEFRTPLSIVSGYTEILDSGELGPLAAEYKQPVGIIAQRVKMLTRLVDDLTSLLDLEAHRENFTSLRLAEVINPMYASLRTKALAERVELNLEIPSGLPRAQGEESLLRKLIDNLVDNAIKFTPPQGKVQLSLQAQNGSVCIRVSDTGVGIPPEEQAKIFERFYQVDGGSSRRYGGTGLGLALAREIVQLHGGQIRVASEPQRGSTFEVQLPAEKQEAVHR